MAMENSSWSLVLVSQQYRDEAVVSISNRWAGNGTNLTPLTAQHAWREGISEHLPRPEVLGWGRCSLAEQGVGLRGHPVSEGSA